MLPPAANVRRSTSFPFCALSYRFSRRYYCLRTPSLKKKSFPSSAIRTNGTWATSGGEIIASLPEGRQRRVGPLFYDNCQIVGKTVRGLWTHWGGPLMTAKFIGNRPFEGILRWLRETAQHEDHNESTGFKGKLYRHHSG